MVKTFENMLPSANLLKTASAIHAINPGITMHVESKVRLALMLMEAAANCSISL